MSSKFARLVVPMIGAVTPGFVSIHASEICAMLTLFFFASSSILEFDCQPSDKELSGQDVQTSS